MRGVSIVIPVYNALEEARQCVESLYAVLTSIPFAVIVVNNGSRPDVAEWLAGEQRCRANFEALHFDEPLGFARAMNEGARRAKAELLVLLNSDTVVTDGWLDRLAGEMERDPGLGIVSPVTNRCGHDVQRDADAAALESEDAQRYAASIRDRNEVVPEAQRLVFFCVMVRRVLWEQLAGFDECFRTGNFEDDDFCLRTRFAGYRMAVARNAFVFHSERKTFIANQLNHGEWLAGNAALFGARVSRWSRRMRPAAGELLSLPTLTVLVPVAQARVSGLRDSLASLVNQTVAEFAVIVLHPEGMELSGLLHEFSGRLRLRGLAVEGDGVAALLNAGLAAVDAGEIAYLPAGDIFYPFHLELLARALQGEGTDAVYGAWSVVVGSGETERRGTVMFPEAEPGIALGDWAPLLCWMHRRRTVVQMFDAAFGGFAPWAFAMQLRSAVRCRYLCRVTCERRPDVPVASDASAVEQVMARFPVQDAWQLSQRRQFLEGVRQGNWEERLVLIWNERTRRARQLLTRPAAVRAGAKEAARLRRLMEEAAGRVEPLWRDMGKPDVLLFSIIEWSALTQRPHHFARGLAARGHRVFWVDVRLRAPEGFEAESLVRELEPDLYHVELPVVQGEVAWLEWGPEAVEAMAACFAYLRAAYGIAEAVQLVNYPRWEPLVSTLRRRFRWKVVYDCLDDQKAFAELHGHSLGTFDDALLRTSAEVFASGRTLLRFVRKEREDAVFLPNAVDFGLFHGASAAGLLQALPRPIVGFFGAFSDWLDLEWMDAAATRFPEWSFVYIGREGFAKPTVRLRWKSVTSRANIHVFPQAPPELLAQYLAEMDVCTMPFQDLPVTRSMNAVKLYEYLAAGKPVVSARLPETEPLREAGLIATYESQEESFRLLEEAVQGGHGEAAVTARIAFAAANTWEQRTAELALAMGLP